MALNECDISHEEWREYEWINKQGQKVIYRIDKPDRLFTRHGGSTHRVSDSNGTTHCIPAPEVYGCVIRWFNKPEYSRAEF